MVLSIVKTSTILVLFSISILLVPISHVYAAGAQKTAVQKQRPSDINIPVKGKISRTGEVYLLRGLANVFSRGMDAMGAKLIRSGVDARVYNHSAWRDLAENIIARAKVKRVSYPIVIIGHSLGANASVRMAEHLGRRGIRVEYVAVFDPTTTTTAHKNVRRIINFYLANDSHSNIVVKGAGFRGVLKNINLRGTPGITHTSVEKNPKYQNAIIKRAVSLTRRSRKKRS